MARKRWCGLVRLIELCHTDADGRVLGRQTNLFNMLHADGEEFLLRAAFAGGRVSSVIPDFYYLGLDNRVTPAASDTMADLVGEPFGGGYTRQQVSSNGDFALDLDPDGHFIATSPIVAFRATTGSWGPVANIFLTDKADATGSLISTVPLASPVSLNPGNAVTMRIGLQIKDC